MTPVAAVGAAMLLVVAADGSAPPERTLAAEATRDGAPARIESPEAFAQAVVELVGSASVNSTAWVHPADRWARDLQAPSRIHVTFTPPREVQVMDGRNHAWTRRRVDEILVVVPADAWPDHVLLRTEGALEAVTKYAPCPLLRVVTIPVPPLSRERYDALRTSCGAHQQ